MKGKLSVSTSLFNFSNSYPGPNLNIYDSVNNRIVTGCVAKQIASVKGSAAQAKAGGLFEFFRGEIDILQEDFQGWLNDTNDKITIAVAAYDTNYYSGPAFTR